MVETRHINLLITVIMLFLITPAFAFADSTWTGTDTNGVASRNGNVGIGTNNPTVKLEVKGTIMANDGVFTLYDSDVNHGMTDWTTTNTPGVLMPRNSTKGGILLLGLSDTDETAMSIYGIMGTDNPTDTMPAINFVALKKNGIGAQALANSETAYQFTNGNTNLINVLGSGNVGIGTISPVEKLSINGNLQISGVNSRIYMGSGGSTFGIGYSSSYPDYGIFYTEGSPDFVSISPNGNSTNGIVNVYGNGKVGIGTNTPDYTLDVNGTIRAKEVKVETNWSDFVFEDNYNLPTLDKVESFIKENKHLPDIPSAKEVEEEGLSMSQMMAKQMQKIEELTLYVIEQNKQLVELKKENETIKKELSEIKRY